MLTRRRIKKFMLEEHTEEEIIEYLFGAVYELLDRLEDIENLLEEQKSITKAGTKTYKFDSKSIKNLDNF